MNTLEINSDLDTEYLSKVYGDDTEIVGLIFDAFITDSYPKWLSLESRLATTNLTEAASIVHGLKPSFMMAGMTWLKPKVEVLEMAIKEASNMEQITKMYRDISGELLKLIPILQSEVVRLQNYQVSH